MTNNMMDGSTIDCSMMGGWFMGGWFMGGLGILTAVVFLLAAAALIKYLFFSGRRGD